jgi:hypothetical protein
MFWRTSSSLLRVRDTRIKSLGAWEAMLRAIEEPVDLGDTPVMRTFRDQWKELEENEGSYHSCLGCDQHMLSRLRHHPFPCSTQDASELYPSFVTNTVTGLMVVEHKYAELHLPLFYPPGSQSASCADIHPWPKLGYTSRQYQGSLDQHQSRIVRQKLCHAQAAFTWHSRNSAMHLDRHGVINVEVRGAWRGSSLRCGATLQW